MSKTSKKWLALLLGWFTAMSPAFATTFVDPAPAVSGQPVAASGLNSRFTAVGNVINGNIDNGNIKSAAAILPTKLDLTQAFPVLRAAANDCFSAGTTGDTVPRLSITSSGLIKFGAGGASAQDLALLRSSSTTFAFRDAGNTADTNITCKNINASGPIASTGALSGTTITGTGAGSLASLTLTTTPLPATSGGTGLATSPTTGQIDAGNGTTAYTRINAGTNGQAPIYDSTVTGGLRAGNVVNNQTCQVRMSLSTGQPLNGAVGPAATLFITPCGGNQVALYVTTSNFNGWVMRTFTETSLALGGLTTGAVYDVFLADNGTSNPTASTLIWSSTTARATTLAYKDGVLVLSSDNTKRYIGSIYISAAGVTQDGIDGTTAIFGIFNYYNRVPRMGFTTDTTASWTYAGTGRIFNGSTTKYVLVLNGLPSTEAFHYSVFGSMVWKTSIAAHCPTLQYSLSQSAPATFTQQVFYSATNYTNTATVLTTTTYASNGMATGILTTPGLNYFAGVEVTDGTSTTFYGGGQAASVAVQVND